MRKSLICFIVFFLIGNNVVWALDAMDFGQEHEKQSHSTSTAIETHHQEQNTDSCDHCCHGSAHLLGLMIGSSSTVTVSDSSSVSSSIQTHVSWVYQPPSPPPNV